MNNTIAQQQLQQQQQQQQVNSNNANGNVIAVGYPNSNNLTMPTAENVAQQQMSYLMNMAAAANPLHFPPPGAFLLPQQQGMNQVAAMAMKGGGFDLSQLMNFNAASQPPVPAHTPSAPIGVAIQPAYGATAVNNTKRSNAVSSSDEKSSSKTDRAKLNRDRNREHARSTRERKKAYVQKLRELVEQLHAERNEEQRKRRVAVQHLAEIHRVRCDVVQTFLQYHTGRNGVADDRKWSTILEDDFWLKQPVTPYRSFHRAEIEKVRFCMK